MDYSALDDNTLIRLIAYSNTEALSVLYDRYSHLVFSVATNVVRDRMRLKRSCKTYFSGCGNMPKTYKEEQTKVSTWLTRIAVTERLIIYDGTGHARTCPQ